LDNKEGFNSEGIYLEFEKPIPRTSDFKEIYIEKATNKYLIPWRNVIARDVSLEAFTLRNKTFKFQLISDRNNEYEIHILLPYAYIGDYITLDEASQMKQRIKQKSEEVQKSILVQQEQLNTLFPDFKIKHESIQDFLKNAADIDKKLKEHQKEIMKRITQNTAKKVTLERLKQEQIAHNIKVESLKNKVLKEKKVEQLLYAEKGALYESSQTLKKSLANPKAEMAYNDSRMKHMKKITIPRYATLLKRAPIQTEVIEASKAGFLTNNDKEFQKLNQVYP